MGGDEAGPDVWGPQVAEDEGRCRCVCVRGGGGGMGHSPQIVRLPRQMAASMTSRHSPKDPPKPLRPPPPPCLSLHWRRVVAPTH